MDGAGLNMGVAMVRGIVEHKRICGKHDWTGCMRERKCHQVGPFRLEF